MVILLSDRSQTVSPSDNSETTREPLLKNTLEAVLDRFEPSDHDLVTALLKMMHDSEEATLLEILTTDQLQDYIDYLIKLIDSYRNTGESEITVEYETNELSSDLEGSVLTSWTRF